MAKVKIQNHRPGLLQVELVIGGKPTSINISGRGTSTDSYDESDLDKSPKVVKLEKRGWLGRVPQNEPKEAAKKTDKKSEEKKSDNGGNNKQPGKSDGRS